MKKIIIIGCPGSGKTTFAEKLQRATNLPLYYLNAISRAEADKFIEFMVASFKDF